MHGSSTGILEYVANIGWGVLWSGLELWQFVSPRNSELCIPFQEEKKSKIPLISFAVISNFPWKLRNPFYYKAQTRQIPSLIKPSMSVCGRAAKYVPNHLRLSLKKNREEK